MSVNTFWAIVANAMVIGGAVGGALLGGFIWFTWPEKYRESHREAPAAPERRRY